MHQWMIYGANGYAGRLLAREAVKQGLQPVLAGRKQREIEALATELGLEHRVFTLDDSAAMQDALRNMNLVAHCAGPFSATSRPMIDACLATQTHYLDITGEIDVFVAAHARNAEAQAAGIVLCPGVGFDVIPTDCLAACLKQALPDADQLALGFDSRSGFSPGTAKTSVEGLKHGGKVRIDDEIATVPLVYQSREIDFGDGTKYAVTIPWGDVATAWFTTGIDNIAVFVPMAPSAALRLRRLDWLRPVLALAPVQAFLKYQAGKRISGPDVDQRRDAPTFVWGEAQNPAGKKVVARVKTANGYDVTVHGTLLAVRHMLSNEAVNPGYYTPARLLGDHCVEQLPGSGSIEIS
ncbi:saccharopine dehydrogenase family protein [Pseudomonas saliphila]|uniref:saccharopine dehydrogenase family protein n=1 Tax=Pseudomonas saliphila TaxID=2586906 RepID=UPI001F1FF6CE|nr:saccharopine dehydrogenase NADP-binding domain-containing protein [Pseudomonas saliphila]